jgi:hypothetical protein
MQDPADTSCLRLVPKHFSDGVASALSPLGPGAGSNATVSGKRGPSLNDLDDGALLCVL